MYQSLLMALVSLLYFSVYMCSQRSFTKLKYIVLPRVNYAYSRKSKFEPVRKGWSYIRRRGGLEGRHLAPCLGRGTLPSFSSWINNPHSLETRYVLLFAMPLLVITNAVLVQLEELMIFHNLLNLQKPTGELIQLR